VRLRLEPGPLTLDQLLILRDDEHARIVEDDGRVVDIRPRRF
jgi:hypothetical protein